MGNKTSARWKDVPQSLKDRVINDGGKVEFEPIDMGKPGSVEMVQLKPKTSKYRNKRVEYDGHKFDSIKEKDYYIKLQLMMKAGELNTFILQPRYYYDVEYSRSEHAVSFTKKYFYQADFEVIYADGHVETVDVKGDKKHLTREFVRKRLIIKKLYNIEIKIV